VVESEPARLGTQTFSINSLTTRHSQVAIAKHVTMGAPTGPLLMEADRDVEVPAGWSPFLDRLIAGARVGSVRYLTRDGQRVAAVVAADMAESMFDEPPLDDDDPLVAPAAGPPTLADLQRAQGVRPVDDPAELRGPGMPDFDQFFAAVMSARSE
jgi:hypothetical protein